MRIVIDLQACQSTGSRFRGIGRYSKALAQAMLRAGRGHDFWIALNGGLPDAVEDIRASFDGLLPQEQIVLWDNPFPVPEYLQADPWKNRLAELLREDFLHSLKPDIVHLSSLFEGWGDAIAASIGRGSVGKVRTAITLYDLIPLAMSDVYLRDPSTRRWYERKLEDLGRADLCLAISAFTRRQGMQLAGLDAGDVVNISGSIDPVFRRLRPEEQRRDALRGRYGIQRPFVMYTGGFDPRKNIAGLIRAYAGLPEPLRAQRQLVIVGDAPANEHAELLAVAGKHGLSGHDLNFVGFVPDTDLVGLYNLCELYVFPSRCEGFGLPALEAMACGAPVIAADASSLPEVIGYPEAMFAVDSDAAMTARMVQGLGDAGFRQRLIEHAAERVQLFSWAACANTALDAMEALLARATTLPVSGTLSSTIPVLVDTDAQAPDALAAERGTVLARQSGLLADLLGSRRLTQNQYRRLALAQSASRPAPTSNKQLIVDISHLVDHDAKTGIQRVVRNILRELFELVPDGYRVEPVYFDKGGTCRYAREFIGRFLDLPATVDSVLVARPGDVFLGLDLSAHIVPEHYEQFDQLRRNGVAMYFVVYDLVPLLRPDCVNPDSLQLFHQWYGSVGKLADGLCCISRAVADQLLQWCDQARPPRERPLHIGHFHLGADIDNGVADGDEPASERDVSCLGGRRSFLMVSTIEPRKGYRQALAAFELLWAKGEDVNLVIVGKPGWSMQDFIAGLRGHAEFGQRLHWFEGASDSRLLALYAASSALLTASEGEGFGLPIVEAARHGLPVIARDLPVFKEVAAQHAYYFSGHDPDDLASALIAWLGLHAQGLAPASTGIVCLDWRESAEGLLRLVFGQRWDASWRPNSRYWFPATDERLLTQVGRRERSELVGTGNSGFLVYGPYVPLPAGGYCLRVSGRWSNSDIGQAWLDVVCGLGQQRLAHVDLQPEPTLAEGLLLEICFELDADAQDLEIRLWVSADADLRVRGLELCADPDPA